MDNIREEISSARGSGHDLCGSRDEATVGATAPLTPVRVQLRRTKGWRLPPNTVKVDRTTKWGNQIVVGSDRGIGYRPWTAQDAVDQFRADIEHEIDPDRPDGSEPLSLEPLRGKNLACWCAPGAPCHADVLLELANAPALQPEASRG